MGKHDCWLLSAHGSREHVKALRPIAFAYLLAKLQPLALDLRKALACPYRACIDLCWLQTIAIPTANAHHLALNVAHGSLCTQRSGTLVYLAPCSTLHRQQL